jgi:hypothetical protein
MGWHKHIKFILKYRCKVLHNSHSYTITHLEIREYGRGDPLRWPRDTLCPQKLALTSQTSGGRSVDIVHSQTKATVIIIIIIIIIITELFKSLAIHFNRILPSPPQSSRRVFSSARIAP